MRILVTSDFHGNPYHAEATREAARIHKPDVFVYAGDISPVRHVYKTPEMQREMVEKHMFKAFNEIDVRHKFVMPGNTDFASNCQIWKHDKTNNFMFVQDQAVEVEGYHFMFLSTVPETDHCLKDCEAIGAKPKFYPISYVFSGTSTNPAKKASDGLVYGKDFEIYDSYEEVPQRHKDQFEFSIKDRLQTIQGKKEDQKQILFTHAPPKNVSADAVFDETRNLVHIGCQDIADFISDNQTIQGCFSGHIHQSVIVSKQYEDRIKNTQIFTTGNTGIDYAYMENCYFLIYDTETKSCERVAYKVKKFEHGLNRIFE